MDVKEVAKNLKGALDVAEKIKKIKIYAIIGAVGALLFILVGAVGAISSGAGLGESEENGSGEYSPYGGILSNYTINSEEYYIISNAEEISNYARSEKHYQDYWYNKGSATAGDACLGVSMVNANAIFYADKSIIDDNNNINMSNDPKLKTSLYGNSVLSANKEDVLKAVYSEVSNARACIFKVNGNSSGSSRHYVVVVGYKKTTDENALKETDFLILDAWDAQIEQMNGKGSSTRFMVTAGDPGGYQMFHFPESAIPAGGAKQYGPGASEEGDHSKGIVEKYTSSFGRKFTVYAQPKSDGTSPAGYKIDGSLRMRCGDCAAANLATGYGSTLTALEVNNKYGDNWQNFLRSVATTKGLNYKTEENPSNQTVVSLLSKNIPLEMWTDNKKWASGGTHFMVLADIKKEGGVYYVYVLNSSVYSNSNGWHKLEDMFIKKIYYFN